MLTRPQSHEAEAEATTHEAEATTLEAEAMTHLEILIIIIKNSAVSVLPWPALPARYDVMVVIINRKTSIVQGRQSETTFV